MNSATAQSSTLSPGTPLNGFILLHPAHVAPGKAFGWSLLLVIFADAFLFQPFSGVSTGVFGLLMLGVLAMVSRPSHMLQAGVPAALFLLSLIQTAHFADPLNVLVLVSCGLLVLARVHHGHLAPFWPRLGEGLLSLASFPSRYLWFLQQLVSWRRTSGSSGGFHRLVHVAQMLLLVVLPSAALFGLFLMFLADGNAILGQGLKDWMLALFEHRPQLTLPSPLRVFFWIFWSGIALVWLFPAPAPNERSLWRVSPIHHGPHVDRPMSRYRGWTMMTGLNLLFLMANTIDGLYLWVNQTLPHGVTYSEFVHRGTFSLFFAVVLSAFVLCILFRKGAQGQYSRGLKLLGLLWVVQNLFLLASVGLRLKLYVDAYGLTRLRFYLLGILVLTGSGFVLLALKVIRNLPFRWLVLNTLAVLFFLGFGLQFINVPGVVADYNVQRYLSDPKHQSYPDYDYLLSLGNGTTEPLLDLVREAPRHPFSGTLSWRLKLRKSHLQSLTASRDWRSWNYRNHRALQNLRTHFDPAVPPDSVAP